MNKSDGFMQRCEVCGVEMETLRVTQRTCSRKCAGSLGGRKKVPKGFAITGTASESGKKSRRKSIKSIAL